MNCTSYLKYLVGVLLIRFQLCLCHSVIQGVENYLDMRDLPIVSQYTQSHYLDMRDLPIVSQYAQSPDPPGSLEFLQAAKPIMDSYSLNKGFMLFLQLQ